jgi:queuosine precursor transporter
VKKDSSTHLSWIAVIFIGVLILSNLTCGKIITIFGYHITSAILFFPFTYVISDIVTEVYGYNQSRRIIWRAFLANLIVVGGAMIVSNIPAAIQDETQRAFDLVYSINLRIFAASLIAYLCGELINSFILAKSKIIVIGKYFGLRAIISTMVGAFIDTAIFTVIAFSFILPFTMVREIVITEYIIKIAAEILVLPLSIFIVRYLKNKDKVDYYDYNTKFNPFSIN